MSIRANFRVVQLDPLNYIRTTFGRQGMYNVEGLAKSFASKVFPVIFRHWKLSHSQSLVSGGDLEHMFGDYFHYVWNASGPERQQVYHEWARSPEARKKYPLFQSIKDQWRKDFDFRYNNFIEEYENRELSQYPSNSDHVLSYTKFATDISRLVIKFLQISILKNVPR